MTSPTTAGSPNGAGGDHEVYLEHPVRMAFSRGAAVWSFAPELWGRCMQARTVDEALTAWTATHGPSTVVETIQGDEQAFRRDAEPATDDELELTLSILADQRPRAQRLLVDLPPDVLTYDDPNREMPDFAGWRTIRQMLWHICDAESRYYLPRTGLPGKARAATLDEELVASADHVRSTVSSGPRDLLRRADGEVWTATKMLRRLAWHERDELDAIQTLLDGWR